MSFIDIIKAILIFFYQVGEGVIIGAVWLLGFATIASVIIFIIANIKTLIVYIKDKFKKDNEK